MTSDEQAGFVAKLDPRGRALWARQIEGGRDSRIFGLATNDRDDVIVTGNFHHSADLGTGPLSVESNEEGAFVALFDSAGRPRWAFELAPGVYQVAAAREGDIYLLRSFVGTLATPAGTVSSQGMNDVLITKLASDGTAAENRTLGGMGDDDARGIAVGGNGTVWVTGTADRMTGDHAFGKVFVAAIDP